MKKLIYGIELSHSNGRVMDRANAVRYFNLYMAYNPCLFGRHRVPSQLEGRSDRQ